MNEPARSLTPPGWSLLGLLTAVAALVLAPAAWSAGFLNFDDPLIWGAASPLRGPDGLSVALDPSQTVANAYLPVSHASIWLDLWLFEGARGPHLVAVALQVLVAWILARVLVRLGVAAPVASVAAVVFLVHPALVESALWLSGRKDLLASLFGLMALGQVAIAAQRGGGLARTAVAALLTLLAVYSKGTAIVLPMLAVAVAFSVPRVEGVRTPWGVLAAIGLVSVGAAWHHYSIAAGQGTLFEAGPWDQRLQQVPGAFAHYTRTAIWPTDLDVLYPEVQTLERFREQLVIGLVVCAALLATVIVSRRASPTSRVALGVTWFVAALLPFNTALPATSLAAADRYLHLALPGAVLALTAVPRAAWVLGVLAVPLAIGANARASDFVDNESLWGASLERDDQNAVALLNLATERSMKARPPAEITPLVERAVEVARYPQHRYRAESALSSLAELDGRIEAAYRHALLAADAARESGDGPQFEQLQVRSLLSAARLARLDGLETRAEEQFARAKALAPLDPLVACFEAAVLLAQCVDGEGRVPFDHPNVKQAAALLDAAERVAPALYEIHFARGEWALAQRSVLEAQRHLEIAIALDPSRPDAHAKLADVFLSEGMFAEAEAAIRRGIDRPHRKPYPGLLYRLAYALKGQPGKGLLAREWFERYLDLRPRDADARRALAGVLVAEAMSQLHGWAPDKIDEAGVRILELDSGNPKGLLIRGIAARGRREMHAALVLFEQVREALPEDEEVHRLYAETLRDRGWDLKLREDRPDAAFDHFRRFLDVAPETVPTDAVRNALYQEWKRKLKAGQAALLAQEFEDAVQLLQRCLALRPDATSPNLQLGMAQLGLERHDAALACFEIAEAGQRARGIDPSIAVLYRIKALVAKGDVEGARVCRDAYLKQPFEGAPEDLLERIRDALPR